MASNIETSSGGYDVHVIEKYPKELNCGICALIIHNAMHGCINHAFCKSCIMKHIECRIRIDGNVKCPGGCGLVIDPSKLEPNKFADRMINTLTTKCGNENCMWQGDLLDLVQVHQMNCDYLQQYCSNAGCWETYLQKDLLQHEEACLFKLIPCSYCHTNIFRKIKENHEFECSNEKVNCSYYDLGCEMQLCRKDVASHEETHQATHMRLMQQSLNKCVKQLCTANNKILVLNQQSATSNNEITVLKQRMVVADYDFNFLKEENSTLKKKLSKLETKVKREEFKTDEATENMKFVDIKRSREMAKLMEREEKNAPSKVKVVDIDSLTSKLSLATDICGKVSLINDVMIVKANDIRFNLDLFKLSGCYTNNYEFDFLVNEFGLDSEKDLMVELFTKIPFHFFEYQDGVQFHTFIFQIDLSDIKNIDVFVPDQFRITISNNEIKWRNLTEMTSRSITLYIGNYRKQLQSEKKFDLQELENTNSYDLPFAHGYACIDIIYS